MSSRTLARLAPRKHAFKVLLPISLLGLLLGALALAQGPGSAVGSRFDHATTGYELIGMHRQTRCESCHVNAIFKGTPTPCSGCHSTGTRIAASVKSARHIMSSNQCDDCHTPMAWQPASRFDHTQVQGACSSCHNAVQATGKPRSHPTTTAECSVCHTMTISWAAAAFDHAGVSGNCQSCHNGAQATGKGAMHILTSGICEACHVTSAWRPAVRVDHSQVMGTCVTCHNGTNASGKPADHVMSDNACENCHNSNAWTPARFDHKSVQPGTCSTCHNGVRASGKSVNHITTTQECDACHSTLAWKPAMFSHTGITGNCQSCHNGSAATGKSVNHMSTARDCNVCHNTTAWTPLIFRHTSPAYPGEHRGDLGCTACHTTNTDQAVYRMPAYAPDCGACHANRYKADPHNKTSNEVKYTVSELRNCSGACHVYTDTTLTTIQKRRNGPQHRVADAEFGG